MVGGNDSKRDKLDCRAEAAGISSHPALHGVPGARHSFQEEVSASLSVPQCQSEGQGEPCVGLLSEGMRCQLGTGVLLPGPAPAGEGEGRLPSVTPEPSFGQGEWNGEALLAFPLQQPQLPKPGWMRTSRAAVGQQWGGRPSTRSPGFWLGLAPRGDCKGACAAREALLGAGQGIHFSP